MILRSLVATALACGMACAQETAPAPTAAVRTDAEAQVAMDRALAWLVAAQFEDGAFAAGVLDTLHEHGFSVETFHAWQVAAHALACKALLEARETPERRAALDRGLEWFVTNRMPLRGSDWDNDAVWGWLYGTVLAVAVAQDERYASTPLGARVTERGKEHIASLLANQIPEGGFGYYDDPPFTRRPKWATSFCTALALPALKQARDRDWFQDDAAIARALKYVRLCRLPNGAYAYDLRAVPRSFAGESIDATKGSLGRIQVCNWARWSLGDPGVDVDAIRLGIQRFFAQHEFLEVARMRPIPHEGFYANAGYFFLFGHHYAAQTIELLPDDERPSFRAQLRERLCATQRPDGSFCDFGSSSYQTAAGTAFAALALRAGLPRE
ncbi:MAG: hypothetical protein HZB39_09360 [Planctomycetes bacterium]|nr:hypothetical protein [Planctomycetota bacterium]